jgi:predicted ATPase/class 3 adenylate cyclase
MVVRPSGVVCFLFTDVEGSTQLWSQHTAAMEKALARHDEVLDAAIRPRGGFVFSTAGDSVGAAFSSPAAAMSAAIAAQTALHRERWDGMSSPLRVRMGLHLGTAHERAHNYFGPAVNLAARVMSAAWGGQILCTDAVAAAVDTPVDGRGEHRLRDIPDPITLYQVLAPALPHDFPPLRTLDVAPSTLPAQRSTFFGRHDDIGTVRRVLIDHRLVTLTGPGGVGKTRLAIEIAGREQPRRPGGAFFVDLSSVDGRVDLAATVAAACLIDVDASQPPLDQLTAALAGRDCLVVFDNCEHVLDPTAEIVDELLARCPQVTIIATSREALGLSGEQVHVVGSLDTAPGAAARALFVERASAVGGGMFEGDDPQVGELCARLEGIPLAIELAAARTRTLSLSQIVERLERGLDLLAAKRRGEPDRHQTLRATIEWSYRLLDDDERALFDRLCVFAGSFDLAAAASVGGRDERDLADLLDGLVLKSMVVTVPEHNGPRRYRMLDTLRAFAIERLQARPDALDDASDAHARHYLSRLADLPPWRFIARDLRTEFEPDLGNILIAFDRAESRAVDWTVSIARASDPLVFLLTHIGLFAEAKERCDAALARADDIDDATRGNLLVARAFVEATQDGTSDFLSFAAQALDYLTPGDGVWSAAFGMTSVVDQMLAPDKAVPALEDALARIEGQTSAAADHDRAMLQFYLGGALMSLRDYERAAETQLRAAHSLETIEPTSLARLWTAAGAAMSLTVLGRFDDAAAALDDVSALAGWTDWSVDWFFARAYLQARRGETEAARETLRAIGMRFDNVSVSPMTGTVVAGFGIVAYLEGHTEHARSLLEILTTTRAAASTAVLYQTIADVEGWSDADFDTRRLERVIEIVPRQVAMTRDEFFAALGDRLREELAQPAAAAVDA